MIVATIVLGLLAAGLLLARRRQGGSLRRGVVGGWQTLRRTLALLLMVFAIVGFVNVLAPQTVVQAWLGPGSGWSGLLLAEGIGIFLPGGPCVVFPLIAVIYEAGAGLGPAVTLITSWATLALISVTVELPFLG